MGGAVVVGGWKTATAANKTFSSYMYLSSVRSQNYADTLKNISATVQLTFTNGEATGARIVCAAGIPYWHSSAHTTLPLHCRQGYHSIRVGPRIRAIHALQVIAPGGRIRQEVSNRWTSCNRKKREAKLSQFQDSLVAAKDPY